MRRISLAALGLIMALTMLATPVLAAKKMNYMAVGTLDRYYPGPLPEAAKILGGHWIARVKGNDISFYGFYRELNIDPVVEQSPAGTVDMFWIRLIDAGQAVVDKDGTCTITGTFRVDKRGWGLNYKIYWLLPQWTGYGTMRITPTTIDMDLSGHAHALGTTISAHY